MDAIGTFGRFGQEFSVVTFEENEGKHQRGKSFLVYHPDFAEINLRSVAMIAFSNATSWYE